MREILLGCDPELFVRDTTIDRIISAHGLLEGDKLRPEIVDQGAVQIDGMALEFNINPAKDMKEWLFNIDRVMKDLKDKIHAKNPNLKFELIPVADFSPDYMDTVPPEARMLGCTPDFNAYTGKQNPTPSSEHMFRTASGHVHIGWTDDIDPHDPSHFADCCRLTQQLDATLYNLSLIWDTDTRRRSLYGARGAFRPKPYGLEYRVLSNSWLKSKALQAWVYSATVRSSELLDQGTALYTDDKLKVKGPYWVHDYLVDEHGFPPLPLPGAACGRSVRKGT